ncbi:E4, partial [Macaca fascicularis papillomavirus 4]
YNIPTLCLALPSAKQYPLLKLLADCNTQPPPIPTPAPRAPKKTPGRPCRRLLSECEEETQVAIQCGPWTVTAGQYSLELHTTTLQGTQVTVNVRLCCI